MKSAAVLVPVAPGLARRALAHTLAAAGAALDALARRVAAGPPPRRADPVLEFHAEAGAPEGALYVDGELVAWVPGVTRL